MSGGNKISFRISKRGVNRRTLLSGEPKFGVLVGKEVKADVSCEGKEQIITLRIETGAIFDEMNEVSKDVTTESPSAFATEIN